MIANTSARFSVTIPKPTLERLDRLKQEVYYDRTWSQMCLHLIQRGIDAIKADEEKGR